MDRQKTALISVYNKEGIEQFGRDLKELGFNILASGGTARALTDAGVEVTDTASLVGEAILGHRVVTLSREIHAGLLARDIPEDLDELKKLRIPWIDLVCVDLYPLEKEIAKLGSTLESVIEKTDIGGPTMLRSGAKGRRIVICDPTDRLRVTEWIKRGQPDRETFIANLIAKTEAVVSAYCLTSARYHSGRIHDGLVGKQVLECKYGENGWQTPAGLFSTFGDDPLGLDKLEVVAGTAPSYNNWCDVERLLQTTTHIAGVFDVNNKKVPTIAVGVKHGNSCGASVSEDSAVAFKNMLEGDLRAIFGGVVMVNCVIDRTLAEILLTHKMEGGQRRLLDGIVAPSFSEGAIDMLKRKADKCRFMVNPALGKLSKSSLDIAPRIRYVRGGFLRQPNYTFVLDFESAHTITHGVVSHSQKNDLLLAWAIGSTSNSNTVTLVKEGKLLGNGVGQQDRVGCCQLAIKRAVDAGHDSFGAVAYSDSFFPFIDGVEVLAHAGVTAIFATSGSVRDTDIIEVCAQKNIGLILQPDSKARGFFGH